MDYYLSILTFTFVAGITPGPNNMMLMASGLNHGVRKSLPHYFGICIGFPLMVIVLGFGLSAILSAYPNIYLFLKISGIVYLLYLAWKIANAGNPKATQSMRNPLSFLQAAAFQWLNPKAWVIAIGALAAFASEDALYAGVAAVVLAYFFVGFICMGFWLGLGQNLKVYLNDKKRIHYFNAAMAMLLALSVIPMALSDLTSVV